MNYFRFVVILGIFLQTLLKSNMLVIHQNHTYKNNVKLPVKGLSLLRFEII